MRISDALCEEVEEALAKSPLGARVDFEVMVTLAPGPAGPIPFVHLLFATASPIIGAPPVFIAAGLPIENAITAGSMNKLVPEALEALAQAVSAAVKGESSTAAPTGLILP